MKAKVLVFLNIAYACTVAFLIRAFISKIILHLNSFYIRLNMGKSNGMLVDFFSVHNVTILFGILCVVSIGIFIYYANLKKYFAIPLGFGVVCLSFIFSNPIDFDYLRLLWMLMFLFWIILLVYIRWYSKERVKSWGITLFLMFCMTMFVVSKLQVAKLNSYVGDFVGKITGYILEPVAEQFVKNYYREQMMCFDKRTHKNVSEKIESLAKEDRIEGFRKDEDLDAWMLSDEFKKAMYRSNIVVYVINFSPLIIAILMLLFAVIVSESLVAIGFVLASYLMAMTVDIYMPVCYAVSGFLLLFFILLLINLGIIFYGIYHWNNRNKVE